MKQFFKSGRELFLVKHSFHQEQNKLEIQNWLSIKLSYLFNLVVVGFQYGYHILKILKRSHLNSLYLISKNGHNFSSDFHLNSIVNSLSTSSFNLKRILFIAIYLLSIYAVSGQSMTQLPSGRNKPNEIVAIKALKVGDTVPDRLLKASLSIFDKTGAESNITLDDFKEKVIVIDLWGTWCTYCINSFPHLFHLQNKFQEKIKVLPVVNQSRARILTTLNKSPIKNITGFVTAIDSTFGDYFPTMGFPHVIVIANTRIVSITLPEYLTEEAIEMLIVHNNPYMPIKKDDAIMNSSTVLSSSFKDVRQYQPLAYRTILGFQDGLISNVLLKRDTAITRWLIPNMDIMSLFEIAYFDYNKKSDDFVGLANFPNRRIILTPELTALLLPKPLGTYPREARLDVQRKYYYTYENLAAHSISDEKLKIQLAEDLDNFLNVKSRLLMVPMECYVIARKSNLSSDFEENIDKNTFLRYLNHPTFKLPPVLIEKGLYKLPKISLEDRPYSLDEIKKICEIHGLKVYSQICRIPMLMFYKGAFPDVSKLGKLELDTYGYIPAVEKQ
ncbi:TlpA family protein disulfide reductase [Sphingobacterium multivorum]|uniref:TlpA family protein disulfide reductase n=1 Tax=Sphingobacterium multivorum TaxID=28454 RepID=UPI00289C310B|nr:redoxin family protein [Sphingobacterium multivorum]